MIRTAKNTLLLAVSALTLLVVAVPVSAQVQEGGSVGLEGRISSEPPKQGATISFPRDGTASNNQTTTVSGICPSGLLVKVFRNNVFAGSVMCVNGSFSLQIDLFPGRNEIVVRVFDDLDQAGPDSNVVVVNLPMDTIASPNRVTLTSTFAKRGANPGQTLTWPITLSGGNGPYAITVDWGDGKTEDIISQAFPGTFNITHVYDSPGVYNIIVRATDRNGVLAFLQLVGVANGPAGQGNTADSKDEASAITRTRVLWQPAALALPLIVLASWLGGRYVIRILRKRLGRRENLG